MPIRRIAPLVRALSSSSVQCSGRKLITAAHEDGIPAMPGCFTPTEILSAWDAGADVVKVFPATSVGPSYLKDIRGPLPHVKLMPTGGVSIDNIGDWLRAGAVAVGIGSALLDAKAISAKQYGADRGQRAARRRQRSIGSGVADGKGRHLRRDHAPAEPARLRAFPSVAAFWSRHLVAAKRMLP